MTDRQALLEATVRKLHAERKLLHEMLTEAGIPEAVRPEEGRTCLIGRVGVALGRLARNEPSTAEDYGFERGFRAGAGLPDIR